MRARPAPHGSDHDAPRAPLTTGICGGYTTFSTSSYETAALLEEGVFRRATLHISTSILVSLAGTVLAFTSERTRAARWGILGTAVFPLLTAVDDRMVLLVCPIGAALAAAPVAVAKGAERGAPR